MAQECLYSLRRKSLFNEQGCGGVPEGMQAESGARQVGREAGGELSAREAARVNV